MDSSNCWSLNAIGTASHSGFPDSAYRDSRNCSVKIRPIFRDYNLHFGTLWARFLPSRVFFIFVVIRPFGHFVIVIGVILQRILWSLWVKSNLNYCFNNAMNGKWIIWMLKLSWWITEWVTCKFYLSPNSGRLSSPSAVFSVWLRIFF